MRPGGPPLVVAAPPDPLVEAFFDYLDNERNSSAHTVGNYSRALAAFRAAMPTAPGWLECDTEPFREYLFQLMKRGQARAYVRLQFAALRSFYKFLCARRGLALNPLKALHLPKAEKKLPQLLTPAQIDELFAAPFKVERAKQAPEWMPARDVAVMELFYSSGLRLAELAALNVEDIDPYTETVRVLGKGRKERVCPVGLPALEAVQRYRHAAGVKEGAFVHQPVAAAYRAAFDLAVVEALPAAHDDPDCAQPAQAAAFVRHAPARQRRGPAQRAGTSWTRQPLHDADLHEGHDRAAAQSVRRRPPACVGRRGVHFLSGWPNRASAAGFGGVKTPEKPSKHLSAQRLLEERAARPPTGAEKLCLTPDLC